jgi:hypothetical protein
MWRIEAKTGVFDRLEDAVGGVGGAAGMKMDGRHAAVAMMETMRTMLGIEPRKGLMSCASWNVLLVPTHMYMGNDKNLQRHQMDLPDLLEQSRRLSLLQ